MLHCLLPNPHERADTLIIYPTLEQLRRFDLQTSPFSKKGEQQKISFLNPSDFTSCSPGRDGYCSHIYVDIILKDKAKHHTDIVFHNSDPRDTENGQHNQNANQCTQIAFLLSRQPLRTLSSSTVSINLNVSKDFTSDVGHTPAFEPRGSFFTVRDLLGRPLEQSSNSRNFKAKHKAFFAPGLKTTVSKHSKDQMKQSFHPTPGLRYKGHEFDPPEHQHQA